ncbi:MAG: ATP-dependent DNA helicase RecG [Alphaproteobacteria bacterium]|nr:ATP-dependent DNA helicase RecG [Alphaproteobacteria bacterium]
MIMRSTILNPLFAPVRSLPGIGPKLAPLFDRLLAAQGQEARLIDVLLHLPHSAIDRRLNASLSEGIAGESGTYEVRVLAHKPSPPGRARVPYRVLTEDDTDDLTLVFFSAQRARVEAMLPIGSIRFVSGKIENFDNKKQMVHPDRVLDAEAYARLPPFEPVYGLTAGLYPRVLQKASQAALPKIPALEEWIDPLLIKREKWPSFAEALKNLHSPKSKDELAPEASSRLRLAYDELFAGQLALLLMRERMKKEAGTSRVGDGQLMKAALAALPFSLTDAQRSALEDIKKDLAASERMLRLLQGDVGSGKTIVAFLAMVMAAEAGWQSALMAPTEILARQHFERLKPFADTIGLSIVLLTGREKGAARTQALTGLADGTTILAIGTHALFQESVEFKKLGLAVIDEQHRFGVHQRLALAHKGDAVDMLVMTATPIPRTLVLTWALPLERLDEIVESLNRPLTEGRRIYWVCPLVDESEDLDLAAVEERADTLRKIYGDAVGLVHGKMKGADKDRAMADFASGKTKILVATTVIEVGVDVPEASIMIIEHAERFGLAQLHQLRGRVGRGAERSSCVLLYGPLGEIGRARIDTMRKTEDGFEIAEEDLKLRGEGDVLGTRQSGMPGFRLAVPSKHSALLSMARDDAKALLAKDSKLQSARGQAVRNLLYLFERDEAIRLVGAG